MPSPKQAVPAARRPVIPVTAPDDRFPLNIGIRSSEILGLMQGRPTAAATLAEIQRHVLRIGCRRCLRTVEIQTVDALCLYGGNALWKDVGQRLLDDTCQQRTGRLEEDGCWPAFDVT